MSRAGAEDLAAVVIGAGPAGAATALLLAGAGLAVLLIGRDGQKGSGGLGEAVCGDRPGESLAPEVRPLLQRLGVLDRFLATEPLPCYGNRSVWGGAGQLAAHDFITNRHGHGWHIDRRRFDAMLLEAATGAGATFAANVRIASATRLDRGWRLLLRGPAGERVATARLVVDASGRASAFARRQGARRLHDDYLVAATAFLRPGGAAAVDSTTLVEATPDGWWYSALLPDGRLATAFFTDPDLAVAHRPATCSGWLALLHATEHTRHRVKAHDYRLVTPPRLVAAGSARLEPVVGDGWLAAGDAAASYDPLSSHGIGSALAGGLHAAAAIRALLAGNNGALPAYAAGVAAAYALYLDLRRAYYADERRWSAAPFWQRRGGAT